MDNLLIFDRKKLGKPKFYFGQFVEPEDGTQVLSREKYILAVLVHPCGHFTYITGFSPETEHKFFSCGNGCDCPPAINIWRRLTFQAEELKLL